MNSFVLRAAYLRMANLHILILVLTCLFLSSCSPKSSFTVIGTIKEHCKDPLVVVLIDQSYLVFDKSCQNISRLKFENGKLTIKERIGLGELTIDDSSRVHLQKLPTVFSNPLQNSPAGVYLILAKNRSPVYTNDFVCMPVGKQLLLIDKEMPPPRMLEKGVKTVAKIFDYSLRAFRTIPMLHERIGEYSTTILPDGRIFIAGGKIFSKEHKQYVTTNCTEVFDPVQKEFIPGPKLHIPRAYHSALCTADGRVIISGGSTPSNAGYHPTPLIEICDLHANAAKLVGRLLTARVLHSSTILPNGDVLISGGCIDSPQRGFSTTDTNEIFESKIGKCMPTLPLSSPRQNHLLLCNKNTDITVIGGVECESNSFEGFTSHYKVDIEQAKIARLYQGENTRVRY